MELSVQQRAYILAKARFESTQAIFQAQCDEKNLSEMFKIDFETALLIEQQLSEETGFSEAKRELYHAENVLIEWLFESISNNPWYQKNKNHLEFLRRHYWVSTPIRVFIIAVASQIHESITANLEREPLAGPLGS